MKITAQMHFAKALQLLRKQGVEQGNLTPEELYSLAEAARRCADPFRDINADAAGFPVRVCEGVWFWRLTIGAGVWLDEMEELLGGGTSPKYRLAMIYALVHSREPEAFKGLGTERAVMRAVRATMRTIHATPAEVDRAMDAALGLRADEEPRRAAQSAAADWASLCVRLETQTGIPAVEWMWSRSGSYAIMAYNDLHAFARAYGSGGRGERMLDELDDAMTALKRIEARISRRVRVAESEERKGDKDGGGDGGDDHETGNEVGDGASPDRGAAGKDHPAGHSHQEAVVGAGKSGGGVCVIHDGADCTTDGEEAQA